MANVDQIYLDYSASTPVDPMVLEKMLPYFSQFYANPSSQHRAGWQAQRGADQARIQVMQLLNARLSKEIIFTSGASEANSIALLGYIQSLRKLEPHKALHALTSQVEHKSVLATFEQLRDLGVEIEMLPVNAYGQIEVETVRKSIRKETVLMSFMWANNEIGSLNPISELAQLANEHKICFHSDATQACGKFPVDLQRVGVDFLSLSGHKMYGPKGAGALFVRHEGHHAKFPLWPLIRGGGQEFNLRAGTLNIPGIVGLGEASRMALTNLTEQANTLKTQSYIFFEKLKLLAPNVRLNGHPDNRIPGHLHLTFPGVRWDQWLPRLSQLCVSTTSACSSESGHGSHVLNALGFKTEEMQASLRISLGKFTTEQELEMALGLFQRVFIQA